MELTPAPFTIHEAALPLIEAKLAKLVKRALRVGVVPPNFVVVERFIRPLTLPVAPPLGAPVPVPAGYKAVKMAKILVTGPVPVLKGWEFIGTLQKLEGNVIVRSAPGREIPVKYRTGDPEACDYCKTRRTRNDTFIVHKVETDLARAAAVEEYQQVGRNCLADFIGTTSPEDVARYAEALFEFREICAGAEEDHESYHSSGDSYTMLQSFLEQTAARIRVSGWVSVSKVKAESTDTHPLVATVNSVWGDLYPLRGTKLAELAEIPVPTEEDKKLAEAAQEWARNLTDADTATSDYLHNLRVIASQGAVSGRLGGYAASIVPAYQRRLRGAEDAAASEYVGKPGERQSFVLRFVEKRGSLFRFKEGDVNEVVMFSDSPSFDTFFAVGGIYSVTATVKRQDMFRGTKTTYLTRMGKRITLVPEEKLIGAPVLEEELEPVRAGILKART